MFIRMIHVKASQADEDIEDKFGDNQSDDFLKNKCFCGHQPVATKFS